MYVFTFFVYLVIFQVILPIVHGLDGEPVLADWDDSGIVVVGAALSSASVYKVKPCEEKGSLCPGLPARKRILSFSWYHKLTSHINAVHSF